MPSKETITELSRRDQAFLNVAIALAGTSKCRQRHGCVIVAGGSILATGVNKDRNDPRVFDEFTTLYGLSAHAEFEALRRLDFRIVHRAVAYVARVNRQGEPRYSRPCNKCYPLLVRYGIKEVVYTTHGP